MEHRLQELFFGQWPLTGHGRREYTGPGGKQPRAEGSQSRAWHGTQCPSEGRSDGARALSKRSCGPRPPADSDQGPGPPASSGARGRAGAARAGRPHTRAAVLWAGPAGHRAETGRHAAAGRAPGRAPARPHCVRHPVERVPPAAAAQPASPPAEAADQHRGRPGAGGQVVAGAGPREAAGGKARGRDGIQLLFPERGQEPTASPRGGSSRGRQPWGRALQGRRGRPGGTRLSSRGAEGKGLRQGGPGPRGG